ncbi:hypothetical protein [cyanobacterium endosymbiont of Rhopalodia gibberula]|nr:hypothetical protein [cyanobacterium endosymbiont of Rhopalodia gibberula]
MLLKQSYVLPKRNYDNGKLSWFHNADAHKTEANLTLVEINCGRSRSL